MITQSCLLWYNSCNLQRFSRKIKKNRKVAIGKTCGLKYLWCCLMENNELNMYLFLVFLFLSFQNIFGLDDGSFISKIYKKEIPKTFEFFPGFFPQASQVIPKKFSLNDYFKRYSMFDQVTTLATFDILLLRGSVLDYYGKQLLLASGYEIEEVNKKMKQALQSEKNNSAQEVIVFIFPSINEGDSVGLEVKSCPWHVSAKINKKEFRPIKIDLVKSDEIIQKILDYKFEKKRRIYKFTFMVPKHQANCKAICSIVFRYLDFCGEAKIKNFFLEK